MGLVSNIVEYHLLILQTSHKKVKSRNLLQDFNAFTDIIPVLYPDAPRMGLYVLGRNVMPYILFKTDNHELDKPAPTVHGRRLRSGLSDTSLRAHHIIRRSWRGRMSGNPRHLHRRS